MTLPTWLRCCEPGCEAPHEPHSLRCAPHRAQRTKAMRARREVRADRRLAARAVEAVEDCATDVIASGLSRCACGALLWPRDIAAHRCELPAERLLRICSERHDA